MGVVIRVNGLAEVDGIAKLLLQYWLARVPRNLEQEETGVGLGKVIVWRVVLVQNLRIERRMTIGIITQPKWSSTYYVLATYGTTQLKINGCVCVYMYTGIDR